jgi:hypothetical protein
MPFISETAYFNFMARMVRDLAVLRGHMNAKHSYGNG